MATNKIQQRLTISRGGESRGEVLLTRRVHGVLDALGKNVIGSLTDRGESIADVTVHLIGGRRLISPRAGDMHARSTTHIVTAAIR